MQALHLVTRGEKTLVGTVTTSDGNLVVGTATSGTVNVPKADVTALRNEEEQAAYEKSLHPTLVAWLGWRGECGLCADTGEQRDQEFGVGVHGRPEDAA